MESNGQKGRIQVSQSTAELLVAAGKQDWVTPREDKIEAKGKGWLQTYWVNIDVASSAGTGSNPRTASTNGSMSNAQEDTRVGAVGDQAADLSRQQHREYKDILSKIKQEVHK